MNDESQPSYTNLPETSRTFNRKQPHSIREKSFAYALRAINLYRYLQKQRDGAAWILGKQYLRAACSTGANVEEAQCGESRADFVHKLGIAAKEARESLYWLHPLVESGKVPVAKLGPLIQENGEMTRILNSIILTTKRGRRLNGATSPKDLTQHS